MPAGRTMLETWTSDLRYALRRLRHRPTYTALTVLTLALGVAGTAAVFGIAKRLLFEPLPYRAEEEIAVFWFGGAWTESELAYLRPEMNDFTAVAAARPADATLDLDGEPTRLVRGWSASARALLGARRLAGAGSGLPPRRRRPRRRAGRRHQPLALARAGQLARDRRTAHRVRRRASHRRRRHAGGLLVPRPDRRRLVRRADRSAGAERQLHADRTHATGPRRSRRWARSSSASRACSTSATTSPSSGTSPGSPQPHSRCARL